MTEISMNKAIHLAVRRDLARFIDALEAFVPGDQARARGLATAWANFDEQLTHHHEGEHEIAWPTLKALGVDPEVLTVMDDEHEAMAAALVETRAAMGALARTAGADDAKTALACFEKLQAVTVQHLEHEEAVTEHVYVEKRDTAEIKGMERAFGRVSPTFGGRFFAWILDDAGPDERAAVTRFVPKAVVTVLSGTFGRGYRKNVAAQWKG